jgi:hypothetical protein
MEGGFNGISIWVYETFDPVNPAHPERGRPTRDPRFFVTNRPVDITRGKPWDRPGGGGSTSSTSKGQPSNVAADVSDDAETSGIGVRASPPHRRRGGSSDGDAGGIPVLGELRRESRWWTAR